MGGFQTGFDPGELHEGDRDVDGMLAICAWHETCLIQYKSKHTWRCRNSRNNWRVSVRGAHTRLLLRKQVQSWLEILDLVAQRLLALSH